MKKIFDNKVVFVTGGTGSFGKYFIKSILDTKVKKIISYSRTEFLQMKMQNEIKDERIRYFIGDVRDKDRLEIALKNVDIIIHAAALKQVPAIEYNPFEAVKTNIIGAQNIILCAIRNNVKKIVALSTDKSSSPINFYGASKLISDKLFQSSNVYSKEHSINMSVVRYGNVAGSRGSVIPFFKDLIKDKNNILPVTHPDMTRFWISLEEACNLVFLALNESIGSEIFVPKLPSFRIIDLIKAMDCNYELVGIREGEKIHEEMINRYDTVIEYDDYFKIIPEYKWLDKSKFNGRLKNIINGYNSGDNENFLTIDQIKERLLYL
jgi:UDP-N-acetylglucosamine 4,6-dehydratase (inverting)